MPLVVGVLAAALYGSRSATHGLRWALLAGILIGVATLTRQTAVVLVVPVSLAFWIERPRWSRKALMAPLVLLTALALSIAPWAIRNLAVRSRFVVVAAQSDALLEGTYNHISASDSHNPYRWGNISEVRHSEYRRDVGVTYIENHPLSVFAVGYWNTRRLLELAGSGTTEWSATRVGLTKRTALDKRYAFWIVGFLALIGAFTRPARAAPRWFWVAGGLLFVSVVLVQSETPRFRTPLDPFFIVLATLGVIALARGSALAVAGLQARAESRQHWAVRA